ncbi:MAG: tRNA (adenosine(37)-N6)-threonylcarbamoyltransferase complex ATPase subunit type 1 TsaE [Candidatus Spechtbacterales bacterium]
MKQKIFKSVSVEETKKIAAHVLDVFWDKKRSNALVVGLTGELGAGKTHFAQGVAEHLGLKRNITSPTFVIMKKYGVKKENFNTKKFSDVNYLYHFDCYRVGLSKEVQDIGWDEIVSNLDNIVLVEWAERIKTIMPDNSIYISIENTSEDSRVLTVSF